MANESTGEPRLPELGELGTKLLALARHPRQGLAVAVSQLLDGHDEDEIARETKTLVGRGAAIVHIGQVDLGERILSVLFAVRSALSEEEAARMPLYLLEMRVAMRRGDLGTLQRIAPLLPASAAHEVAALYEDAARLRDRLAAEFGQERGEVLTRLVGPFDPEVRLEVVERTEWARSGECFAILEALLESAPPSLRDSVSAARDLVGEFGAHGASGAKRRADAEELRERVTREAEELLEGVSGDLAAALLAAKDVGVTRLVDASIDALDMALTKSSGGGIDTPVQCVTTLLLFFTLRSRTQNARAEAISAGEIAVRLSPGVARAVPRLAWDLATRALQTPPDVVGPDSRRADLHVVAAEACAAMEEELGTDALKLAVHHANQAVPLRIGSGDNLRAAAALGYALQMLGRTPVEEQSGPERALAEARRILAAGRYEGLARAVLQASLAALLLEHGRSDARIEEAERLLEEAWRAASTAGKKERADVLRWLVAPTVLLSQGRTSSGRPATKLRRWLADVENRFADSLGPMERGLLLVARGRLRARESDARADAEAVRDLAMARNLAEQIPHELDRGELLRLAALLEAEAHVAHGRPEEAIPLLNDERVWSNTPTAAQEAERRALLVDAEVRRRRRGFLARAGAHLEELLRLAVRHRGRRDESSVVRACGQASLVWCMAASGDFADQTLPQALLCNLSELRENPLLSVALAADLGTLLDVLRQFARDDTKQPVLLAPFRRLVRRAEEAERGDETTRVEWALAALYAAVRGLGPGHDLTQDWARAVEGVALDENGPWSPSTWSPAAHASLLSDLASVRLDAGSPPDQRHVRAAARLLRHAEDVLDGVTAETNLAARLELNGLRVRVLELWHRRDLDADAVATEAERIHADASRLSPDSSQVVLKNLLAALQRQPAAMTDRCDEVVRRIRDELDMPPGSAREPAPQLASSMGPPSDPQASTAAMLAHALGLAEAGSLQPQLAAAASRIVSELEDRFDVDRGLLRFVRGIAHLYHPGSPRTEHLRRAIDALDGVQFDGDGGAEREVERLLHLAEARRQFALLHLRSDEFVASAELAQARVALEEALEEPRVLAHPERRGRVARLLGIVLMDTARDPVELRQAIDHLDAAVRDCGDDPADEFATLVSLGNAHRRLLDWSGGEEERKAAIAKYEEALRLATSPSIPPLERARAEKCLADALASSDEPEDLERALALLHAALQMRTSDHAVLRAEALVSLANVELRLAAKGVAGAAQRARSAALEAQELLPEQDATALAEAVARLRVEAERILGIRQDMPSAERPHTELPIVESAVEKALLANLGRHPRVDPQAAMAVMRGDAPAFAEIVPPFIRRGVEGALTASERERIAALREVAAWGSPMQVGDARGEAGLALASAVALRIVHEPDKVGAEEQQAARDAARTALRGLAAFIQDPPDRVWTLYALSVLVAGGGPDTSIDDWRLAEEGLRTALSLAASDQATGIDVVTELRAQLARVLYHRPGPGQRDRWEEALRLYEQVLPDARQDTVGTTYNMLLLNFGVLLDKMSDDDPPLLERAVAVYSELLEVAERGASVALQVQARANRAWALTRAARDDVSPDRIDDALRDLEVAATMADEHALRREQAWIANLCGNALVEMARIEHSSDRLAQALNSYERSASLWHELADAREEARARHNIGTALLRFGDVDAAFEHLLSALAARVDVPAEAAETLFSIAGVRRRIPVPWGSHQLDDDLGERLRSVAEQLQATGAGGQAMRVRSLLLELRLAEALEQRVVPSPDLLVRVKTDLEDASAWWSEAASLEAQHEASSALGEQAALTAGLQIAAGMAPSQILATLAAGRAPTLSRERAARSDGMRLPAPGIGAESEPPRGTSEAEHTLRQIRQEAASRESLRRSTSRTPPTPDALEQAVLSLLESEPDTAYVDLATTSVATVALVGSRRPDGRPVLKARLLDVSTEEMSEWFANGRGGTSAGWFELLAGLQPDDADSSADSWLERAEQCAAGMERILLEFHARVLEPVLRPLRETGTRHLVLSMHGPIANLPFAAASRVDERGRVRRVVEDFESVRVVPSPGLLLDPAHPSGTHDSAPVLLVGVDGLGEGPTIQRAAKALADELAERDHAVTALLGEQATAEVVLQSLLGRRGRVHFHAHGVFDDHQLARSGLVLADGLLACSDLLHAPGRCDAEIVVLSSCRSARTRASGATSEWLGLAGTFVRLGARQVLAALWSVFEAPTATLLREFHRRVDTGQSPAIALASLQRAALEPLRADGNDEHPLAGLEGVFGCGPSLSYRGRRLLASPLVWAPLQLLSVA